MLIIIVSAPTARVSVGGHLVKSLRYATCSRYRNEVLFAGLRLLCLRSSDNDATSLSRHITSSHHVLVCPIFWVPFRQLLLCSWLTDFFAA